MIEIYNYGALNQKVADLKILSGYITHSMNAAYTLQASTAPRTLEEDNLSITPFTVFKVENIYYRSLNFSSSDNVSGGVDIDAMDLLSVDLSEFIVSDFTYENASVQAMISGLLNGTIFTLGTYENLGSKDISLKNNTKLSILNEILKIFNCELEKDHLQINIKNRIQYSDNGNPFLLVKGKNVLTLEESIDSSAVVTRLKFIDSSAENPQVLTLDSQYINNYPTPKEAYKEFKGSAAAQAATFLSTSELPNASYKVSIPFNLRYNFKLGTLVKLKCDQLNIDLDLRVMELTRDLTNLTGDSYILGQKPKNFIEFAADLFIRKDEIKEELERELEGWEELVLEEIEEELDTKLEEKIDLIVPEIIEEVYERIEFPPLPGYLIEETLNTNIDERARQIAIEEIGKLDLSGAFADHIIIDHQPTQSEIDSWEVGSLVLVYDPVNPYTPSS